MCILEIGRCLNDMYLERVSKFYTPGLVDYSSQSVIHSIRILWSGSCGITFKFQQVSKEAAHGLLLRFNFLTSVSCLFSSASSALFDI